MSWIKRELDNKIETSAVSNDFPMTAQRMDKVVTEKTAYLGDLATRRKIWVSGVLKNDAVLYISKATTSAGSATFYLTDDGTSGGNAVFSAIHSDSIAVVIYGSAASYQPFTPTVSGDNKSVTISVNQVTSIIGLSLIYVSASNGVDCRLYATGDPL